MTATAKISPHVALGRRLGILLRPFFGPLAGEPTIPAPLTARRLFWAIFWALWAFSLSAALVFSILRAAIGPPTQ